MMGKVERRYDRETRGPQIFRPFKVAHGIIENVMFPKHTGGGRIHLEFAFVKAKIVAVVRPQHQPMSQQSDRIAINIFRRVDDFDPRHLAVSDFYGFAASIAERAGLHKTPVLPAAHVRNRN
jgi:hypothetical protein